MITFATAGKPDSFGNKKYPRELPDYLAGFGLNGYEVECGRGINISDEVAAGLLRMSRESGIRVSLHTPYYISVSSVDEEIRERSVATIVQSAEAARRVGADRIIVHSGSCAKISRESALELAVGTFRKAREAMDETGFGDILICPETMGKINQLGTLEEVLRICEIDERMLPCVDFGHLNARTLGGIKSRSDYASAFDLIRDSLGDGILQNLHIHFSKIEYTKGGEKKHLTFADEIFGPDCKPMLDEIFDRRMTPFIVCESDGTQAEDCAVMRKYYESIGSTK